MNTEEAISKGNELVESAITSLSKPLNTPTFGGVDTSGAKKELKRAAETRDAAANTIDVEGKRNEEATREIQKATKLAAEASVATITADAARAQQTASIHQQFSELFGINLDPSSDIATVAVKMRQQRQSAEADLAEIQDMQSVGILDNPLEFLANVLKLPSKVAAYNTQATRINNMQKNIDNSIQTSSSASAEIVKTIPTITAAQAAAAAAKVNADSMKAVAEADKKLAGENIDKKGVLMAIRARMAIVL